MASTAPATKDGVIPCPVTAATLLEDRAELRRTAVLDAGLPAGTHRLRLGPVGPLAVDRSLRAELEAPGAAADIRDVRLVRLYTPPPEGAPGPDASALRHRVHELTELMRRLEADQERTGTRVAVLEQLLEELRRDIAESTGAGEADPGRWTAELDRAYGEHTRHADAQRVLLRRIARTRTELGSAKEALDAAEEQPLVLSAFVDVVVETGEPLPEGARLRLVHLTPCALWRPAYRAELSADGRSLALQCDAVAWQRTGEDWTGAELSLSTARTTQAAEPPNLSEDVLLLVDRTPEERRTIEVDLREVDIQNVGPTEDGSPVQDAAQAAAAALTLPGVDDGGEARLLTAPAPVDLPSDGRAHRIGLASATLPARAEYSCAPELSPLVTQVARFSNSTGQVLLSGPVDLVRGSGFVGRSELRFTAEGAPAELSFGSEDTFRVTRSVEESRDTTAVTGRTVITRTVRLALSRFAPADAGPLSVVVRERIPVSEITAVEVRLDKERSSPTPEGADADGIVRYDLTLNADDRRTLTLGYEITASRAVMV